MFTICLLNLCCVYIIPFYITVWQLFGGSHYVPPQILAFNAKYPSPLNPFSYSLIFRPLDRLITLLCIYSISMMSSAGISLSASHCDVTNHLNTQWFKGKTSFYPSWIYLSVGLILISLDICESGKQLWQCWLSSLICLNTH